MGDDAAKGFEQSLGSSTGSSWFKKRFESDDDRKKREEEEKRKARELALQNLAGR